MSGRSGESLSPGVHAGASRSQAPLGTASPRSSASRAASLPPGSRSFALPNSAQFRNQTGRSQATCTHFVHYKPTYVTTSRRKAHPTTRFRHNAPPQVFFRARKPNGLVWSIVGQTFLSAAGLFRVCRRRSSRHTPCAVASVVHEMAFGDQHRQWFVSRQHRSAKGLADQQSRHPRGQPPQGAGCLWSAQPPTAGRKRVLQADHLSSPPSRGSRSANHSHPPPLSDGLQHSRLAPASTRNRGPEALQTGVDAGVNRRARAAMPALCRNAATYYSPGPASAAPPWVRVPQATPSPERATQRAWQHPRIAGCCGRPPGRATPATEALADGRPLAVGRFGGVGRCSPNADAAGEAAQAAVRSLALG